jgi:hypothetical protein|tara:strand:- start:4202 stop:4648 length:447 start_codon:yes stop_codon:yes gene_type:complete
MKSKTLSRIGAGCLVFGFITTTGGLFYDEINKPSIPPRLERYYGIERKLDKPSQVRLRDLKSKSAKLIAHANELEAERYKIELKPDFSEVRDGYEFKRKNVQDIASSIEWGGLGLMLLSFIPFVLSDKKRREISEEKDKLRYGKGRAF